MPRLLSWPHDVAIVERSPLSGPRSHNAASSESLTGFIQTVASAFGAWRWQFTVRPMRGSMFRRYRGMATALHGGANAVRVEFCDPDGLTWEQSGIDATAEEIRAGTEWSNGASWSNGENWAYGRPWEGVAVAADQGDDEITILGEHWGHLLGMGDWLGFAPFHFGLYVVTEVIEQDVGSPATSTYRVWPPFRKPLTTSDYATLEPVMVMRPEGESAVTATRGRVMADANTLVLTEVEDADVRDYYTG
jgi:hypothetical protein